MNACADRQLTALGWRTGDGAAVEGSRDAVWPDADHMAQSQPNGEEARGRDSISATMASLRLAAQQLLACGSIEAVVWRREAEHYLPLIERIIDQTERRVFAGQRCRPAKSLSICSRRMRISSRVAVTFTMATSSP